MAGILLSGPAGGGKSAAARQLFKDQVGAVIIDFQSIYAALAGLDRGPEGRYPERNPSDAYLLPTTEYLRRAAITAAVERNLEPIVTNSDGNSQRRADLLGFMGAGAVEQVIDPGRDVVVERLSINGTLSQQCGDAISRWYSRV